MVSLQATPGAASAVGMQATSNHTHSCSASGSTTISLEDQEETSGYGNLAGTQLVTSSLHRGTEDDAIRSTPAPLQLLLYVAMPSASCSLGSPSGHPKRPQVTSFTSSSCLSHLQAIRLTRVRRAGSTARASGWCSAAILSPHLPPYSSPPSY